MNASSETRGGVHHEGDEPRAIHVVAAAFSQRRDRIFNACVAFAPDRSAVMSCMPAGRNEPIFVGDDGKLRWSKRATNLDEALERADRLHAVLVSRGVHKDVLAFCRAELLQQNYFHAVFEAMKSIAAKIRNISGLTTDGPIS